MISDEKTNSSHLNVISIADRWSKDSRAVVYEGDNRDLLRTIPRSAIQLIVTSPPYNVGKEYEQKTSLGDYLDSQKRVINSCVRVLNDKGSLCWQVGNYVTPSGEVVPLDTLMYPIFKLHGLVLRNRIVWHFGHGLHSRKRFSGRYETILWFTKDTNDYYWDLDSIRVPQKYPGKRHYKGPKAGEYSGHPQGKNPGDYWDDKLDPGDTWDIPNVKANHIEKTVHPCQFPIALVTRLIRALSSKDTWILDPYLGVGSTSCAAVAEGRRAVGAEVEPVYAEIARQRIVRASMGTLGVRPLERPVYEPPPGSPLTVRSQEADR